MSILPDLSSAKLKDYPLSILENQPSKTYYIDFKNKRAYGYCDELKAVEQAIFKYLQTQRYGFRIYNGQYGMDIISLIAKNLNVLKSEIKRCIREALSVDERIKRVYGFKFENKRDSVLVRFNVETIFGMLDYKKEVTEWQT